MQISTPVDVYESLIILHLRVFICAFNYVYSRLNVAKRKFIRILRSYVNAATDVKKNLKTVFKNVHVIYLSSFDSKASRLITIIRVNGLFIY